jgi:starch synthase
MKTGGLGDVGGSLPQALKKAGCDIRVMIPKFMTMPEEYKAQLTHVTDFRVSLGWRNLYCGIEQLTYKGVTYYFVDNEYYFNREMAYGYFDDGERVAFFSKAIVESLQYLPDFKCDVLHCNDWHTALSPVFLREFYQGIPLYENVKTVMTVHNLKFQGQMSDYVLGDILGLHDIPAAADQLRYDDNSINFMKGGLSYSDILSTVSQTYADEIKNPFFGEGLDDIFRRRSSVLYGIMNGIDTTEYDPAADELIAKNYSMKDMTGKAQCKEELQKELGLAVDPNVPLIVMIGRLTEQKGMDLLQCVIDEMMDQPLQLAVLGTGDEQYENMLRHYEWKHKGKLCASICFNGALSHRMYAGADMLLMPSLFEPCGLSQMIAMRYGTLPVVRETGGLKDSVVPYNQYTGEGTGFSFANYNAHEMLFTIKSAVELYIDQRETWNKLVKNAMSEDFSWSRAADQYMNMYSTLHPEYNAHKK